LTTFRNGLDKSPKYAVFSIIATTNSKHDII